MYLRYSRHSLTLRYKVAPQESHKNTHCAERYAQVVSFNEPSGSPSLWGSRKSSAEFSSSLSAPETGVSHTASHLTYFLTHPHAPDSCSPARSHTSNSLFPPRASSLLVKTLAVSPCLCSLSYTFLISFCLPLLFSTPSVSSAHYLHSASMTKGG